MTLPNREAAYITASKLMDYLLSESHPVGKYKAQLLRNLGYHNDNASLLERGLIAVAREQDVAAIVPSPYGPKYVIDGTLNTPSGTDLQLRTIWIIYAGESRPRFVTAYPL